MAPLTPRQTAALTAVDHAEVTIRPGVGYVSERSHPAWDTHDVTALITDGYAREGRDHVHLTRAGQHRVAGPTTT